MNLNGDIPAYVQIISLNRVKAITMEEIYFASDQINEIAHDLAQLRLVVDLELAPQHPFFSNKPYPLGRCREIRDAMFTLLTKKLSTTEMKGLVHLRTALQHGAQITKAWGSLRDEYFQNTLILNNWYIDTANDTVNANKPRVEILLLKDSKFCPITSFSQFIKIAESYWQVKIFKNTVCPALAPFMPLLCINTSGASWLAAANDDMISLAMKSQFEDSKSILGTLPSPPTQVAARWSEKISSFHNEAFLCPHGSPEDFCDLYKKKKRYNDVDFRNQVVIAFSKLPKTIRVL